MPVPIMARFGTSVADRSEGHEKGENPSLYSYGNQSPMTPLKGWISGPARLRPSNSTAF